jgi:hypothetical protein
MEFSEQTRFTGSVAKARFSRSALGREFGARLLRAGNDQTMRDLGDVCGARNTQFEQEFLDLFRAETVSAYDGRDRIGDFCVADYLAELDTVHVMRYSTRFRLHLRRTSSCPSQPVITTARECSPPPRQRALASFMTSDGTQIGKRSPLRNKDPALPGTRLLP